MHKSWVRYKISEKRAVIGHMPHGHDECNGFPHRGKWVMLNKSRNVSADAHGYR